jgi:hypothetical protein
VTHARLWRDCGRASHFDAFLPNSAFHGLFDAQDDPSTAETAKVTAQRRAVLGMDDGR